MDENCVRVTDKVAVDVTCDIHGIVEEHYAAPKKLLECFESLESLLSGTLRKYHACSAIAHMHVD